MKRLSFLILVLAAAYAGPAFSAFDHTHRQWDALLKRYVVGSGVRYEAWGMDRGGLDAYLRGLSEVTGEEYREFGEKEKLAFWINAYNAFTIQVILDHYPIRPRLFSLAPANSIRQIPGVWDDFFLEAAGERYSLNDIEHEILRKRFREPRIHVAINCASVGCPPLRPEAFVAARIEAQLEDQSLRFVRESGKVRLDREARTLYVSKIFSWFGGDFVGKYSWSGAGGSTGREKAVLAFVSRYLPVEDREFLEATPVKVGYLDWDWSLNLLEDS